MPCNCAGLKSKDCCCKVICCPLKSSLQQAPLTPFQTQFMLSHVQHETRFDPCIYHQSYDNMFFQIVESIYERCAAYNLRHCPLKRTSRSDKHVTMAAKDLMILACFLLANLVVFLNLATITLVHFFVLFKEMGIGIKKFLCTSDSNNFPMHFSHSSSTSQLSSPHARYVIPKL